MQDWCNTGKWNIDVANGSQDGTAGTRTMLRDLPAKRVAGIGRNADTATRRTARTARIDCICGGAQRGPSRGSDAVVVHGALTVGPQES